ncbi:hypothetical protein C0J26_08145 [Pseudomonas baetica]|nr:hypothetical protein C0J26_08145 [Pseudomonas baetica]
MKFATSTLVKKETTLKDVDFVPTRKVDSSNKPQPSNAVEPVSPASGNIIKRYSAVETGVLMADIEKMESVAGKIKHIRYTHNTDVNGFMALLSTGRFLATVERNVNWRLDIDSRYAGGVTYIMKASFYKEYKNYYFDDMYCKGFIFREITGFTKKLAKLQASESTTGGTEAEAWLRYIELLTAQSDFRRFQVADKGLDPVKQTIGKQWTPAQIATLKINSIISCVNPQLRIPWEDNKEISVNDIDLVLITKSAFESINESDLAKVFQVFKSNIVKDSAKDKFKLSYNAGFAIKRLNFFASQGRIVKILDGNNTYSHTAGREARRSSASGEASIKQAAQSGLEYHQDFQYFGAGNNSPKAYSLETFLLFQKEYFKHLVRQHSEDPDGNTDEYKKAYEYELARITPLPVEETDEL